MVLLENGSIADLKTSLDDLAQKCGTMLEARTKQRLLVLGDAATPVDEVQVRACTTQKWRCLGRFTPPGAAAAYIEHWSRTQNRADDFDEPTDVVDQRRAAVRVLDDFEEASTTEGEAVP